MEHWRAKSHSVHNRKFTGKSRGRERGNAIGGATKNAALFTHFLLQKFTPLSRASRWSKVPKSIKVQKYVHPPHYEQGGKAGSASPYQIVNQAQAPNRASCKFCRQRRRTLLISSLAWWHGCCKAGPLSPLFSPDCRQPTKCPVQLGFALVGLS